MLLLNSLFVNSPKAVLRNAGENALVRNQLEQSSGVTVQGLKPRREESMMWATGKLPKELAFVPWRIMSLLLLTCPGFNKGRAEQEKVQEQRSCQENSEPPNRPHPLICRSQCNLTWPR